MASPRGTGVRTAATRVPGLPCPSCGVTIVVEPMQLLSAAAVVCVECGLELRVDTEKSAPALDALRGYVRALDRAKSEYERSAADFTGPRTTDGAAIRKPRGSRRPRRRPLRGRGRSGDD